MQAGPHSDGAVRKSFAAGAGVGRTLGQDVAGQHQVDDQEQGAQRRGNHHVSCERRKDTEHSHSILVHQEEYREEGEEPAEWALSSLYQAYVTWWAAEYAMSAGFLNEQHCRFTHAPASIWGKSHQPVNEHRPDPSLCEGVEDAQESDGQCVRPRRMQSLCALLVEHRQPVHLHVV